jgi:hypothetical protein
MSNKFIIYYIKILEGIKLHVTSLVPQVVMVLTSSFHYKFINNDSIKIKCVISS